jgi:hypothetical protein
VISLNKSYKGIRKYIDSFGKNAFDIIMIKWNEESQWYEIETYDDIYTDDVSNIKLDINGQWATTLSSAKRKAMMDTGLRSKDFNWKEIT